MKTVISRSTLLMIGALLLSPVVVAQSEGTRSEEEQVRREALRAEFDAARNEMAEAAREMARLQRELIEAGDRQGRWTIKSDGGDIDENIEFAIEADSIVFDRDSDKMHFFGARPKLGILMSGGENDGEVLGLTPGGGAESAGLQRGDRVVEVNGLALDNADNSIGKALEGVEAGETVSVVVDRDGSRRTFDVTTSSPDSDIRAFAYRFGPDVIADINFATEGLHEGLEDLEREIVMLHDGAFPHPPEAPMAPRLPGLFVLGGDSDLVSNHDGLAPYFGTGDGVVVLRIGDENPLQLVDGDVILSIDGEAVSRPADLGRAMIDREAGETVVLDIMRDGTLQQIEGTVPESRLPGLHRKRAVGVLAPRPAAPARPAPPRPAPTSDGLF